jgi:hypothetical protein
MLQQPNPPAVVLPDDDGVGEGWAGGDVEHVPEEVAAALPDLIAGIGCPDTPAYREVVEYWCIVVICRYVYRLIREDDRADNSLVAEWCRKYPARARQAAKLAAELGPLLKLLMYPGAYERPEDGGRLEWAARRLRALQAYPQTEEAGT